MSRHVPMKGGQVLLGPQQPRPRTQTQIPQPPPRKKAPVTADDVCAVLLAHASSLDVRVTKHAGNETVLAQIARSTPAALRALVAEVRKP